MKPRSILKAFASLLALSTALSAQSAPATLLFEDDFNGGIPGWSSVQPSGTYLAGPLRWQYDIASDSFIEQSNIYTDAATSSPSATAPMLINDANAGTNFTFKARMIAGDNDAFGLIFGYRNPTNFFRVTFTREVRSEAGFPWNGWNVDRKVNNVATNLFGHGTPDHVDSFFNTEAQPFDVTISVTGNNLFSLTVVDDPEGAAIQYKLVEAQPLPAAANGKVGLMTWGMSGTALRGFRIQNPILAPVALVGNPNALTNWSVITPDGSNLDPGSGNGGRPIWSLALGETGSFGTLHENSDAFGGNTPDNRVDFTAPTIVAGSASWTDYLITARIIPGDDDGHGIVLRHQDEANFYRVALRAQSGGAGVKEGLSIQKVVGGVAEEIYAEETPTIDPASNVPYDISALIIGNRLQVSIVSDPLGAAQTFSYGPFDLTGPTVPSGKIGFFSWGMSRLEVDWVRVNAIDGVPLQVTSVFGSPTPEAGLHGFAPGSSVTASVPSPVEQSQGLRHVATGFTGSGSVPASGSGTNVSFMLNEISSLTWNWRSEVQLKASGGAGGQVSAPTDEWLLAGTNVTLTAAANAGFMFTGWSGDISSVTPTLSFSLTRPLTLMAQFAADSDGDSLPDSWEQAYFTNLLAGAAGDNDSDGFSNAREFQRGTNPNSAETIIAAGAAPSRWINTQRDPALPGQLVVRDFGGGFRGIWDNSNDFREADTNPFIPAENRVANVSFEGPRIIIATNVWQPAWNDFTGSAIFSVGDNDGNCVYFRYQDEMNWYRVTISGENNNASWRAVYGVSIQKRVNGVFSEIIADPAIATDPTDTSFYKRVRITVTAQGPNFEVVVSGWNALVEPAVWDAGTEWVFSFADAEVPQGRFGVGTWGQGGGNTARPTNPVNAAVLIEDVVVTVAGQEVFREDWEQTPLAAELPAGWTNPNTGAAAGAWQVTGHGTILQTSNFSTPSSGSAIQPRANGEGPILLAPPTGAADYLLELAFHPFDDDGIGFVYDFADTNNYSRVMFVSEDSGNGRIPQGVNVSRKSNGVWSEILLADNTFIYTNGSPFAVEFAQNGGTARMRAWHLDAPSASQTWTWASASGAATNRFGLATWGQTDAHFFHPRALSIASSGNAPAGPIEITAVTLSNGAITLSIEKPAGMAYSVETSTTLLPGSWSMVAEGQSGATWTTPVAAGASHVFYRLRANP